MNLRRFLMQFVTLYLLFVGVYCGRRSRYKIEEIQKSYFYNKHLLQNYKPKTSFNQMFNNNNYLNKSVKLKNGDVGVLNQDGSGNQDGRLLNDKKLFKQNFQGFNNKRDVNNKWPNEQDINNINSFVQVAKKLKRSTQVSKHNLKTRIINIAVLLPNNNELDYSLAKALPAIELAVNAVNNNNNKYNLLINKSDKNNTSYNSSNSDLFEQPLIFSADSDKMTQSGYESSGYYLNNEQIVYNNWNLRINAMDTNCSSITGPLAAFELYSNKKAGRK